LQQWYLHWLALSAFPAGCVPELPKDHNPPACISILCCFIGWRIQYMDQEITLTLGLKDMMEGLISATLAPLYPFFKIQEPLKDVSFCSRRMHG
jgi:hypothetical protein